MRYTKNKDIFILHAIASDETLLVNLLDAKTLKTSAVVLKSKEIVKSVTGTILDDYIPRSQAVIDQVSKEIIAPIISVEPASSENRQTDTSTSSNPLLVRPPNPIIPSLIHNSGRDFFDYPLNNIGRGDLDPFGRGGGMLFRPDLRAGQMNPNSPFGQGG